MAAMATTRCRTDPGAGNELRGNDGNDTSDGAQ
jgi:hypothetical protein